MDDLMATLMRDDRFEGEVLRVRISAKSFSIDHQRILGRCSAWPILSAAGRRRLVMVLDSADELDAFRNGDDPLVASSDFFRRN